MLPGIGAVVAVVGCVAGAAKHTVFTPRRIKARSHSSHSEEASPRRPTYRAPRASPSTTTHTVLKLE